MHQPHLQLISGRARRGRLLRRDGYTITELVAATCLSLAALAAFLGFNRFQLHALRNQAVQLELQTLGRNFTDLFTREVRRAGMDPGCAKNFEGVAEADLDRIRIKSDLDGDGIIDAAGEDVTYAYNSSADTLERTTGGDTETLIDGTVLSSLGFQLEYYDGAGNPILDASALTEAERTAVRRVRLVLTLSDLGHEPGYGPPLSASFSSNVDLRNRFFIDNMACP